MDLMPVILMISLMDVPALYMVMTASFLGYFILTPV